MGGRRAFVHTGGVALDREATLVVLIHGAGGDHSVWRYQSRWLASSGRAAAAVDLPAHGRSDGPALPDIGGMADWVCGLIGSLGSPASVVIGHSMGSLVALETARRMPLAGFAMLSPSIRMAVHPDLQAAADRGERLAADLIIGWSHTGRARFGPHHDPGVWKQGGNRRLLEENAATLGSDLRACAGWEAPDLSTLTTPALAILGSRDRMTPERSGRDLAARLPAVTLAVIPGASHVVFYEHPSVVNAVLGPWIDGLEAP